MQRKRAESADETRARIVDATVELHEELGPSRTTISAIAERAGVQRLTVYRHFPDEKSLFAACTGQWASAHPFPDPEAWSGLADRRERTERALRTIYAYFRDTERMWSVCHRDEASVPAVRKPMAEFRAYLDAVADDLAKAWAERGRAPADLRATLRHALKFTTWASLAADGLDDARAARLALLWIGGASPR